MLEENKKIEEECAKLGITEFKSREEGSKWKVISTIGIHFYWFANIYRVPSEEAVAKACKDFSLIAASYIAPGNKKDKIKYKDMSKSDRALAIEDECDTLGCVSCRVRGTGIWTIIKSEDLKYDWENRDYKVPTEAQAEYFKRGINSDVDKPNKEVLQGKKDIKGADLDIDKPLGEPTLQDMLNVMTAFKVGAKIQARDKNGEHGWMSATTPIWDWDTWIYRVAPQPKLRPYTGEELTKLCGTNIIETSDNFRATVIGVNVLRGTVAIVDDTMDICEVVAQTLLDYYTTEDLQPIGVEE